MKSILRNTVAGLAIATFGISSAASAATGTANAEAEILTALSVTVDATADTLDFGSIGESGSGGTVTVSPAASQTCSAGLACDGVVAAPEFDVQGVAGSVVDVSFPNATETLSGPGTDMTIGTFTTSTGQLTLDGTGAGSFTIGGTLAVGAGQVAGTYSGVVTVEVLYN